MNCNPTPAKITQRSPKTQKPQMETPSLYFSTLSPFPLAFFSLISSKTIYSHVTPIPTISFKTLFIPNPFLPSFPCRFHTLNTSSPDLTLNVIPVTSSSPTSAKASPMRARRSCSQRRAEMFLRRWADHFPPVEWEGCSHVGVMG